MLWQNPWAWLGLLTLVLPVLVHLFSRRQTRVEPFPSLRFIDVSRLLPTRRLQLTDVPLLLVRLLVLAIAVAALAQPLWRNRGKGSSDAVATAVIVDTVAARADTAALARVDVALGEMLTASSAQMRVDTDVPIDALAGAAAWLATQTGQRQLVIASDFRDGTLDSLDLTLLPKDISVRLVARSVSAAGTQAAMAPNGVVWWAPASASAAEVRTAVTTTVRALGGIAVVDSLPSTTSRVIVMATPDSDSLVQWLRVARPLSNAWMGDVIMRLRADTTLISSGAATALADTILASPFTVIARSSTNAPVIAAAALGNDASARLLLWTRTPSEALATAALLLGASRALEPTLTATAGRATPDSAQLRRWERAPAAPAFVAASARSSDPLTGASDARWGWLVVLALLAVERIMRRSSTAKAPVPAAAAPASTHNA